MRILNSSKNQGLTLIEMIIYIGLYSILISGVLVSVYAIKESGNRNQSKAFVIEEGVFILSKISWALSGATHVSVPNSQKLIISKNNLPQNENPLAFAILNDQITLSRGNKTPQTLHDTNLRVLNFIFTQTKNSGDGINLEKITVSFTLSTLTKDGHPYSQNFSTSKYLRK